MKIIRIIFITTTILFTFPLFIAFFIKKEYTVKNEIVINKPKEEVFNYLKLLKNQDNFSKWATMDLQMKKYFKGTDGTIGFISGWESKNDEVGFGEQEIKKIIEGERIEYNLRFFKPFEANDLAYIETSSVGKAQTKVTWGFDGTMKYPSNLFILLLKIEEQIYKDLDFSLKKLKLILEKK